MAGLIGRSQRTSLQAVSRSRAISAGINTAPTQVPERELREELLWPFERAIKEGHVMSVMPSYNEVDGVPSTASQFLPRGAFTSGDL